MSHCLTDATPKLLDYVADTGERLTSIPITRATVDLRLRQYHCSMLQICNAKAVSQTLNEVLDEDASINFQLNSFNGK